MVVFPEKPVKTVAMNLLFREHAGKASFRDPALRSINAPAGAVVFDGVPVIPRGPAAEGFQVRDVAAGSDFVRIDKEALGLHLEVRLAAPGRRATFFDVTHPRHDRQGPGRDALYTIPVAPQGVRWLDDPRRSRLQPKEVGSSFGLTRSAPGPTAACRRIRWVPFPVLATGQGGAWPSGSTWLIRRSTGSATTPARASSGSPMTWDWSPRNRRRGCDSVASSSIPSWGFRSALAGYYRLFPEAFRGGSPTRACGCRSPGSARSRAGKISGSGSRRETTRRPGTTRTESSRFHYTEPLTWWMPMPRAMPRTIEAATSEAQRLAGQGRREAKALFTSGYHNPDGTLAALFRDEPWNHGAVWSMNSMPGIKGDETDFSTKWNPRIRARLYGPGRKGDLDGEYIDSSEGYVTDELDYRRDHFAAAETPLTFSLGTHRPAIFRGLIAFEYVRAIASDIHGMDKLMMANATPDRLCWLAPMLDVMGTETDWNPRGKWRPMSDADLLYRRALCKGKPFCFLMNTDFDRFSHALVEKYMKRSLAYGFFPGFFSHNASEGHYFTRPELYDRDRPLFRKYVPLCKLVAEAGWEPITGARSSDERVHVERFGDGPTRYLTVFNDSTDRRNATITLDAKATIPGEQPRASSADGCSPGRPARPTLSLDGEDVAVLELRE